MNTIAIQMVSKPAKVIVDHFITDNLIQHSNFLMGDRKPPIIRKTPIDNLYDELNQTIPYIIDTLNHYKLRLTKSNHTIQHLDNYIEIAKPIIDDVIKVYNELKIKKASGIFDSFDKLSISFLRLYLETITLTERKIAEYHFDNFTDEFQEHLYKEFDTNPPSETNRIYSDKPI